MAQYRAIKVWLPGCGTSQARGQPREGGGWLCCSHASPQHKNMVGTTALQQFPTAAVSILLDLFSLALSCSLDSDQKDQLIEVIEKLLADKTTVSGA